MEAGHENRGERTLSLESYFRNKPSCPARSVTPPNMKIGAGERSASNSIFELKGLIIKEFSSEMNV
jgi:hypothetical protein